MTMFEMLMDGIESHRLSEALREILDAAPDHVVYESDMEEVEDCIDKLADLLCVISPVEDDDDECQGNCGDCNCDK
jgi:hypothetical protein